MGRLVLDLSNEKWQCEHIRPGQGIKEEFHKLPCERQGAAFNWNYVKVPGDVYTDLQRVGEIEDPFFGMNMHKIKWVQEQEYWYMCKFNVPVGMKGKEISILFEGVDYSCTVWFNGHELGAHEGMFSPFSFEISPFINFEHWNGGSNILLVRLDPPPRNFERVSGMKFNYNGDYHTGLVPFGIWRPVKVVATETVKIENARIESFVDGNNATVSIDVLVDNVVAQSKNMTLELTIEGKNCDTEKITKSIETLVCSGENRVTFDIDIENANLWWPWDMGEQNLHTATIKIIDKDYIVDEIVETFGIRQIEMAMNPGYTEEEAENPWTFVINGKHTYLRAACWGGQPSLLYGKNSNEKYEDRLRKVKEANINHLRIFGWHPPEIPYFYDLCDELGITVWTNFTFSTNVIRKELPFANEMINECMEIVKERRNHPSAIFWMGGEEVTFTDAHAESGNKKLMAMIGEEIKKYTNTPYGLASPLSNETGVKMGYKPKESQHANEHYYGAGHVFMEEFYPKLDSCIIPELTAASAPSVESLKKFIPQDELWPMGMSWAYHWADIDVLKILNVEVFDDVKMSSLEEFVEATQVAHGIILQYALEYYRRRKPYNSGVALCHFITHWPDIKWGIVDYYGDKKLCFDYVKRTYSPLLISLAYDKRRWEDEDFKASIWIVNDYYKEFSDMTINYNVTDDEGKVVEEGTTKVESVKSNSSSKYVDVVCPTPKGKTFNINLWLLDEQGEVVVENEYTLLVGSQSKAKALCKEMRLEADERAEKMPGFYRYFPEKWE
ncbi:glycoside hydrolase family 2 [Cytobacillus oceanisediminis]|uniref:glycoside hydrolase family 2 protein n=1 Tax=Cytobacillus oceanisediminis TaxID=665099 RepID=UPI001CCDF3C3|nr:sugar-binding domain-containing protein [Cytobacillus oceanisediminis]MBZ9536103.1 glycoside hydrolase family 2 [Cytobacillus oceanisediminis]